MATAVDIVVGQVDRGHARIRPAAADDRQQQFAVLVVQHDVGSQQIRSAHVAAAKVRAVAGAARDAVDLLAALDHGRVVGRPQLRGKARPGWRASTAGRPGRRTPDGVDAVAKRRRVPDITSVRATSDVVAQRTAACTLTSVSHADA